jgi:signal transduction histidine kinase
MSHELRTPLNSVIGFSKRLLKLKDGPLNDRQFLFIERISANGMHLLGLVNDLLDLSKVEAGKMEVQREQVDVNAVVQDVVATVSGQLEARPGVVLRTEVPEGVPVVVADAGRLKQVVVNLVGNALKFTEEGEVLIRVTVTETDVQIAVVDTGIGIPADKLSAIFESFQQAEVGTSRRYGGTGLGLAISVGFCQLMGLHLRVESTVGVGSTFFVQIPRNEG